MILLLPISRFKVEYQVGRGRAYSVFDKEILNLVHKGVDTLEELESILCVHSSVILQSLLNLTHAGWLAVSVSDGSSFNLTKTGAIAAETKSEPRTVVYENRVQSVILDGVTSQVARTGEITYLTEWKLNSLAALAKKLPAQTYTPRLSANDVDQLLFRRENEWLSSVLNVKLVARNRDWLPIEFEKSSLRLSRNLPWHWVELLEPELYSILRREGLIGRSISYHSFQSAQIDISTDTPISLDGEKPKRPDRRIFANVKYDDFLTGDVDHQKYFRRSLIKAEKNIIVSSAFLRAELIRQYDDLIYDCLERGVKIDLLWGYNAGQGSKEDEGVRELQRIAFVAKSKGLSGVLNFNVSRTNSHSKLIIYDSDKGFEVCIGSYNWLSARSNPDNNARLSNLSVIIRDKTFIAKVMRCISSLWLSEGQGLKGMARRWENLARALEKLSIEESGENLGEVVCEISLLLDDDHGPWFSAAHTSARSRFISLSHRVGPAAFGRAGVEDTSEFEEANPLLRCLVFSEKDMDDDLSDEFFARLSKRGWMFEDRSGMHSKLAISDDQMCIGSFNFMSTDVYDRSKSGKEISVVIKSEDLCAYFARFVQEEFFQSEKEDTN